MSTEKLQALIAEERPNLQKPDVGTGKTNMNYDDVLSERAVLAQRLNRAAFYLKLREAIEPDEFAAIADECRPHLPRVGSLTMESTRA
ncbi:MAG: hypothetical protein ABWX90_01365 [Candidatus Saccharimonadales bacterium]